MLLFSTGVFVTLLKMDHDVLSYTNKTSDLNQSAEAWGWQMSYGIVLAEHHELTTPQTFQSFVLFKASILVENKSEMHLSSPNGEPRRVAQMRLST